VVLFVDMQVYFKSGFMAIFWNRSTSNLFANLFATFLINRSKEESIKKITDQKRAIKNYRNNRFEAPQYL